MYALTRALRACAFRNTGVEELGMEGTGVKAKGGVAIAEALEANKHLQTLSFSKNRLQDASAIALATALSTNTVLKKLWISGSGLTDRGALAIARALKRENNVLEELSLDFNKIGVAGVEALLDAATMNTAIVEFGMNGLIEDLDDKTYYDRAVSVSGANGS